MEENVKTSVLKAKQIRDFERKREREREREQVKKS